MNKHTNYSFNSSKKLLGYRWSSFLVFLVVSVFFSWFLLKGQVAVAGGWGFLKPWYVVGWSFLALMLLLHIPYTILRFTLCRKNAQSAVAWSGSIASLILLFDYNYFTLNGQHMDYEGLNLTINGWLAGEIGNPIAVPLAMLVVCTASYWLFRGILAGLDKLTARNTIPRLTTLATVLAIISCAELGHAAYLTRHDYRLSEVSEALPWANILGINSKKVSASLHLLDNPPQLTMQTEMGAMRDAMTRFQKFPDTVRATRKPNILMILVEGWRFDQISAENTPHLWEWKSKGFTQLPIHYSTGNTTPSGLFGATSGMNGFFYQAALETGGSSFALEMLRRMGYKSTIWEIAALDYNDIFNVQFAPSGSGLEHMRDHKGKPFEKDSILMSRLWDSIRHSDHSQPRFDFFLYYSTHFDYYYPEDYAKHQPTGNFGSMASGVNTDLRESRNLVFNKYRNAVLYMDHRMNTLLDSLQKSKILDSTIVVIAGDHGEEFWEDGVFGHTYRLDDWQSRTSALVHFPKGFSTQYKVSSHADFIPTIFDWMGVQANWQDYMTGKSLLKYDASKDYAVVLKGGKKGFLSYRNSIVDTSYKVIFQNRFDLNKAVEEVRIHDKFAQEFSVPHVAALMSKINESKKLCHGF